MTGSFMIPSDMPSSPRLLALDTATDTLYLALLTPAGLLQREVRGGAQASSTLLPLVRELLAEAGCGLADLHALAYGQGPGAFTGLRTACSVIQGLALGVGRPVLALDTLAAVAESARQQGAQGPIWAMQDARMGEVYAARYDPTPEGWRADQPPALYAPEALARRASQPGVAWAGNALQVYEPLQQAVCPTWPRAVPGPAALIALALAAWREGHAHLDAAEALPVYVRDKVAQTTAERVAQRDA